MHDLTDDVALMRPVIDALRNDTPEVIPCRAVPPAMQDKLELAWREQVGERTLRDLIEPAKSYALNKVSQLNALYEYNLAMSRLAKATGWDAIAPDGEPAP